MAYLCLQNTLHIYLHWGSGLGSCHTGPRDPCRAMDGVHLMNDCRDKGLCFSLLKCIFVLQTIYYSPMSLSTSIWKKKVFHSSDLAVGI